MSSCHIRVPQKRPYRIYGLSATYGARLIPHHNYATRAAAEEAAQAMGYCPLPDEDTEHFMVVDAREQVRRSDL